MSTLKSHRVRPFWTQLQAVFQSSSSKTLSCWRQMKGCPMRGQSVRVTICPTPRWRPNMGPLTMHPITVIPRIREMALVAPLAALRERNRTQVRWSSATSLIWWANCTCSQLRTYRLEQEMISSRWTFCLTLDKKWAETLMARSLDRAAYLNWQERISMAYFLTALLHLHSLHPTRKSYRSLSRIGLKFLLRRNSEVTKKSQKPRGVTAP